MFDAVPVELKQCPQWLLWRAVFNQDRNKWDKLPISAITGYKADVTAQASWTSFDTALHSLNTYGHSHNLSGLGFVLGYGSGITGVDLDDVLTTDGKVVSEAHFNLANKLNSYTELSPSRTGLHVLTKATVPGGRRYNGIEVYGQGRFFTVTGVPFGAPRPLAMRQTEIADLMSDIDTQRAKSAPSALDWHAPETMSDADLYKMASNAENGAKFLALWAGDWQQFYSSQSEADAAFVNIVGYYSSAPTQISRLFHASALANRDKAQRTDYVSRMIALSQDRKVPMVAIPALPAIPPAVEQIAVAGPDITPEIGIDASEIEEAAVRADNAFQPPEGFVRTLSEWFYAQSMYPMSEIAIAGALGLMAGICGRQYQYQKQGLNLYMLVLAETGAGKDSLGLGMSRIFNAVCNPPPAFAHTGGTELDSGFPSARCFEGPSKITGKGLLRNIADSASLSMVSVLPEFSQTMSSMSDSRANEGLKDFQQVLLEFYTKSAEGASFGGSQNADKSKDIAQLMSPSFSMLCEGTPARFYEALNDKLVTDGLMSRFIVIEKMGYPEHNPAHVQFAEVSEEIKYGVANLAKHVMQLKQNGDLRIHVKSTAEADAYSEMLRNKYRKRGMEEVQEVHKFLWMRAHQNLTRIAALLAIGCNMYHPEITEQHLAWANRIIYRQVMLIVGKFRRGEVGTPNDNDKEQYAKLLEFVEGWVNSSTYQMRASSKKWQDARAAGLVPYQYLQQRAGSTAAFRTDKRGSTLALRNTIEAMIRSGGIERVRLQGSAGEFYKPHL